MKEPLQLSSDYDRSMALLPTIVVAASSIVSVIEAWLPAHRGVLVGLACPGLAHPSSHATQARHRIKFGQGATLQHRLLLLRVFYFFLFFHQPDAMPRRSSRRAVDGATDIFARKSIAAVCDDVLFRTCKFQPTTQKWASVDDAVVACLSASCRSDCCILSKGTGNAFTGDVIVNKQLGCSEWPMT